MWGWSGSPRTRGGLPGQRGGKDAVAEVGLGAAAGAEVVRGASDGDRHSAGLVGVEQLGGHPAAELSLLGVGGVVAGLGQWPAGGAAVHVDVLHADQPGPVGLRGGEHAGLEGGELLHPTRVGRVQGLVDDLGAVGDVDGELWVGGVAADDLDLIGYAGGAGAVDHPHRLAAAQQGVQGGQADRAGTEDDVTRGAVHSVAHDRGVDASCAGRGDGARAGAGTTTARRGRRR